MSDEFDELILTKMPHFIAVSYQQMLTADSPQEKVRAALHVYELSLRALSMGLISQYLIRDWKRVYDPYLNQFLCKKLSISELGTWQEIFFKTLKVYEGNRDLFFMTELYDFYWDISTLPHRPKPSLETPFDRLMQISDHFPDLPSDTSSWNALGEETRGLLRKILGQLSFIQNYELIRVLHQEEQICTYQRHVGLTVTQHQLTLPEGIKLKPGQFYLNKQNKEFLQLDPLLIFWQNPSSQLIAPTNDWDTGIFESFISNQLLYQLSNSGGRIEDKERVVAFVDLILDRIQQREQISREAEKMTWWRLQEIVKDISQQQMAGVQEKYKPQLYLRRNEVRSAFDDFLSSKKRGFILLGKSGVGKSNFLLALADEFSHDPSVCLLMYDAAYLDPEIPLTSKINEDFNDRLLLPEKIEHIWRKIAKEIADIEWRTILLCIDAINENPQGQDLLRQIYDLIQQSWPWLKIVVTSRPEPWRRYNIKYGVKPPKELLYQAVEMESFTYSQKLEPFSRDELPQVYEKYCQVYKLQTPYEALSEPIRQLLRDPLILFLLAKSDTTIPKIIRKVDVIPNYIQRMVDTKQLEVRDEQFLTGKLMPLLLHEGCYTNNITAQDIQGAGQKLSNEIHVERKLSDGRQVNQSFANLVNAEILVYQGGLSNYEIRFKYERFYEYYLGQHIFEASAATDKLAHYKSMPRQIENAPYTWGAFANALFRELKAGHFKLIQDLALEDDRTVTWVLLDAMVDYGEIEPDQTRQLLLQLITLRQEAVSAKRLTIEAASRLGAMEVLELAAKSPNRVIREMALLPIYSFWERNNQQGYVLLHHLAQETTGWIKIPRIRLIEFLVQISLLIYGKHIQHDAKVVEPLLEIWRTILQQFSWLMPSTKRRWLPTNFMKKFMSKAAGNIVMVALEADLSGEAGKSVPDFFKWSATDREKVAYVAKFMDVSFGELITIRDDILYLTSRGNGITHVVTQGVMLMHLLADKENALPVVEYVWNSNDSWSRGAASGCLGYFNIISTKADTYTFDLVKKWKLAEWSVAELFDPGSAIMVVLMIEIKLGLERSEFLGPLLDISASFGRSRQIEDALGIIDALKVAGLQGYPEYALNSLEYLFHLEDSKVQEALARTISRIGILYPDAVDYFTSLEGVPTELSYKFKQFSGTATGGEILGAYTWDALVGGILIPQSRQTIISFVNDMIYCKSLAEAVELAMEKIIHAIQGNPAA